MKERGRPLKFNSPEELQKKIKSYFVWCDSRTRIKHLVTKDGVQEVVESFPRPYTVEGLAVYLDTNRQTLLNYTDKDAFFDIIEHARQRILSNKIEGGLDRTYDSGVAKFMLINNYGFKDKHETTEDDKNININIQYPPEAK
jgi:hypothetical protein